MVDLDNQVQQSAKDLQDAWTWLQSVSGSSLPLKCFEQWTKRAVLYRPLSGTSALFPARAAAWDLVHTIVKPENIVGKPEEGKVRYGQILMDFAVARHLALTSYVSITWSAYDRLANVCGRLAGIAELAENPRQNPRPCEDILGDREKKKDTLGFASHVHIRDAYSWPLKVSYKIRNWLVHEGYEEGGTPLFLSGQFVDGFRLHGDAVKYLQTCCDYKDDGGKISSCCISEENECWKHRDLLMILDQYHKEIDTMFAVLLKWTVDSFVQQIRIFAGRDLI